MANNSQTELIVSTIAVVLQASSLPPRQIDIGVDALKAILRGPLTIGQAPGGLTIVTSNRDQVEIQVFPNKVDVRESSGDITQGRNKIPRIIHEFLAMLAEPTIQSYGVNFILETTVEGLREWLGNNLLNPDLRSKLGTLPSSNLVVLVLDRPSKVWTVRFEARPGDTLNINFNASEYRDTLPGREQLENEIGEQYDKLNEFLALLGL